MHERDGRLEMERGKRKDLRLTVAAISSLTMLPTYGKISEPYQVLITTMGF